jgi:hypothetical protein
MKAGFLRCLLILSIPVLLAFTSGCGGAARDVYYVGGETAKSIKRLVTPDAKPVLKKKILITPVINNSGIDNLQADEIMQTCVSNISEDEYLVVSTLKRYEEQEQAFLNKPYGAILNPAYVKKSGASGINILLACIIQPVEVTKARKGIWPYRKDTHKITLTVSINAVDTVNGTLVVFEDETIDFTYGVIKADDSDKWLPDSNLLQGRILDMVERLCSRAVKKLRKIPWQSEPVFEDDKYVIRSGRDIGINENTLFELFKQGEPARSVAGDQYFLLGEKTGEAGIRSVTENSAVLDINAGQGEVSFIRVKQPEE